MKNISRLFSISKIEGVTLLLTTLLLIMTYATHSAASSTDAEAPLFMFVQIADDIKVDAEAKTFRLVNVNQQTLFFSDRPERIAGHLKMPVYLNEWTSKAGKDNFSANPPNATISIYEPGQEENTLAVVEITNPKIDGSDLIYSYKMIEGRLPANGGETTIFIDRIGIGGGVGVGYHGVGVGRRGPGVY
ncbi:hypothetical protein HUU61_23815 [Rhodopseudomonas palustris]|nr:hypothetical protein [Rhodopseudomonas palustris]